MLTDDDDEDDDEDDADHMDDLNETLKVTPYFPLVILFFLGTDLIKFYKRTQPLTDSGS